MTGQGDRQLPGTMQGCFSVLLPSSASKTSLLLPTLPGKHEPGEFWHTQRAPQTSLNVCTGAKLPGPWPHACSRSGQRVSGHGARSHHGYSSSRRYLGHTRIHCQGRASSCAFCIQSPGLITSRKTALEKTRIEVVEHPQSHQSLKNQSWAQPALHPSREQS